jgi:chaperone required for assembly of F1-ATPase
MWENGTCFERPFSGQKEMNIITVDEQFKVTQWGTTFLPRGD